MKKEDSQRAPLPGRAKQARRTHFWTHVSFALISFAIAALVYQRTNRYVLAIIFAGVGAIQASYAFVNPFKNDKEQR